MGVLCDAAGEYLVTGTSATYNIDGSNQITYIAVFNVGALPSSGTRANVIMLANSADGGTYLHGIEIHDTGQLSYYSYDGAEKRASIASAVSAGNTYRVVGGYDGTNLFIGVDGGAYTTGAVGTITAWGADPLLQIGHDPGVGVERFNGTIYELRMYNTGLANNVANSDLFRLGVVEPNLIGLWRFDEGTGTTATDLSTTVSNLTLTGGPTWTEGVQIYGNDI